MTWTLIETATERDAVLELYRKDGRFMIRANGLELMNGFHHESETALGAFAAELAPSQGARFLVGGLGLGYTTAALLEALDGHGIVTVAEMSSAVIDWFDRHVKVSEIASTRSSWMWTTAQNLLLLRQIAVSMRSMGCARSVAAFRSAASHCCGPASNPPTLPRAQRKRDSP